MKRSWTILGPLGLMVALLTACGGGGKSPTGPTVHVATTITCAEDGKGGAGGSAGDTTITVNIAPDCVRDNPSTTTTTTTK